MSSCRLKPPRASLSPNRNYSPIFFSHPDQCPSASMSDDSMSLAASDVEELLGLTIDTSPLPSMDPSNAETGMDAELFRVFS